MSTKVKEPSKEEVAHVNLRTALDNFEKIICENMQLETVEKVTSYQYIVYAFLASELNEMANSVIERIAKQRGGKL